MLGRYDNFPEAIHGFARLRSRSSTRELQQTIISALYQLNQEAYNLTTLISHSSENCEITFEVGVAKDFEFRYLDQGEMHNFQEVMIEKVFQLLDFFWVLRYHITIDNGKRVPLKFDYHIIRFVFPGDNVEIQIYHDRGIQRVPLENLIAFLTDRINKELNQYQLERLDIEYWRTCY